MYRFVSSIFFSLLLLPVGVLANGPFPSYLPGYGILTYEDPFVQVYDNTGQSSFSALRYRSIRAAAPLPKDPWTTFAGRRHCGFRPDHHVPKCYVYDDCTYDELYGDGYWQRCVDAISAEYQIPLRTGPKHRARPYVWYVRDREEYGNSYNHYDSYGGSDGVRGSNEYEWYDY